MPRTTLVTGAGRAQGIGVAVVERLRREPGARVVAHAFGAYDGGSSDVDFDLDLAEPGAPEALVRSAVDRAGPLDALVVNHAHSQLGTLGELDAATLDLTWAVNVRAALLLVQAFADQYPGHPDGGRVVLFTSGQHRGPMPTEIPYAVTKGALAAITPTLADALAGRDITVNCLNPGPTDTGWATADQADFVGRHMPRGRWNTPAEAADVVALLLSAAAATITGQVLDAEGGFRRFTP